MDQDKKRRIISFLSLLYSVISIYSDRVKWDEFKFDGSDFIQFIVKLQNNY